MKEIIEYTSIKDHIFCEIGEEIQLMIAQKLKLLLENSEFLIKSAKETYTHQLQTLKGELHWKAKIINTLIEIIGKFENGKRDTQPVPLMSFKNDLTSSQIKLLIAKPTLNQMNNNKVAIINSKFPQKNSVTTVKKKVALTQF